MTNPLNYALFTIVLWIIAMICALYLWRALYRSYTRWKDKRDTAEAIARVEEQRRRTYERLHRD